MVSPRKSPIATYTPSAEDAEAEEIETEPESLNLNDLGRQMVEKVLQMSMFDRKKAIFKKKELNLNELVESVANTFTLRVEHTGGHIHTSLNAKEPTIYVDEMHFTNVIFNLLDTLLPSKPSDLLQQ